MRIGSETKHFIKNPIGIIGLFIVCVYALATLAATKFTPTLIGSNLIVLFIVVFPFVVLFTFYRLVKTVPAALYSPQDFKDEKIFRDLQLILLGSNNETDHSPDKISDTKLTLSASRMTNFLNSLDGSQLGNILWVDDNPSNNRMLVQRFKSLGIETDIALSTEEALGKAGIKRYSSVISDMGRAEGPNAGYGLLSKLRKSGDTTPYYFFAGSNKAEHQKQAINAGAQGSTNSTFQLAKWVFSNAITDYLWEGA